jgi:hypothetical protein
MLDGSCNYLNDGKLPGQHETCATFIQEQVRGTTMSDACERYACHVATGHRWIGQAPKPLL